MSAVGKAIGKIVEPVTNTIFGGKQSQTSKTDVAPRSQEEELLLKQLIQQAAQQPDTSQLGPNEQDKQIQNLFRSHLTNFLAKRADGSIDKDALKAATSFIDQTFTNPAQEILNQSQSQFEQAAAARQAALGRTGGMDSSFQKQLFGNLANQQAQLGSQRGQMISQQYQQAPIQALNIGLQGLGGISQIQQQNAFKPNFLNQLNQQAFANRNALLNQLSGERFGAAGKTVSANTDKGLVGLLGFGSQMNSDLTRGGAAGASTLAGGI